MKYCPACTHQNPDESATCESCGYTFDSALDRERTKFSEVDISGFAADDFIAERYHVVRELGRGGMGVVYLVQDAELRKREVALKMIHANLITHPEARQRFEEEVIISQQLTHRNIVRVHDLKRWQELRFFTMEYISGRSLRELLNDRKDTEPPFTLPEVISIINPLLEALSYADRYTIHRDIKPENIMVLGEFPDVKVKVLDFGIAKTLSPSRFTQTAQALGTAYYMAPEQMTGAKEIDHRVDLYSAGMVLYEMLTGKMAVGRFRLPGELVEELPGELDKAIEKALSPEPEGRFQSAEEMREAFQVVLSAHENLLEELRQAEVRSQKEEKIDDLLKEVQSVMEARQWSEAEDIFSRILELDAGHRQAQLLVREAKEKRARHQELLQGAKEAEERGSLEQAISLLNEAIPLSADQASLQERKTRLESKLDEKRRKAEIESLVRRGQSALDTRRWSEAEEVLSKVLELVPGHKQAGKLLEDAKAKRLNLKRILEEAKEAERKGNLEQAISLLEEALPLSSNQRKVKQRKNKLEKRLEAERREEKRQAKERRIAEARKRTEQIRLEEEEERVAREQAEKKLKRTKYFIGGALWLLLIGIVVVVVILKEEPKESRQTVSPSRRLPTVQSKGRLYVNTYPQNARVRIMNIRPVYRHGMALKPEKYHIEVSASGYKTKNKWIRLAAGEDKHVRISLVRIQTPQSAPSGTVILSRSVVVRSRNCDWTDTGADVRRDNRLVITASGRVTYGRTSGVWNGPGGRSNTGIWDAPFPEGRHMSLVAKIGRHGPPFFVGNNFDKVARSSGRLYFHINDSPGHRCAGYRDNDGSFTARIKLLR